MGSKKTGETIGQASWQKVGVELSSQEGAELKRLKDRLRNGETLTYAEQDRLSNLQRKQITTSRTVE